MPVLAVFSQGPLGEGVQDQKHAGEQDNRGRISIDRDFGLVSGSQVQLQDIYEWMADLPQLEVIFRCIHVKHQVGRPES